MTSQYRDMNHTSVKKTGDTIRFRGKLDFHASALFFGIDERDRLSTRTFDLSDVNRSYPNGLLPIAAYLLAHRKRTRIRIADNEHAEGVLRRQGYFDLLQSLELPDNLPPRNSLKRFAHEDQSFGISNQVFDHIVSSVRSARDAAQAFTWALDELVGNVFHHAESPIGALLHVVVHPQSSMMIFTLADTGMGLLRSLQPQYPNLTKHTEAVRLAIGRGITSKRENQGWGLFGSSQIVREAGGNMTIWSGDAAMSIIRGGEPTVIEKPFFSGTVIEWQLPTNVPIDLQRAIQIDHEPINYSVWKYRDERGNGYLKLIDESKSFGSRKIGKLLRYKLLNAIENSNSKTCIVDFSNVSVITSSFADEFLGKTAVILGNAFQRRVFVSKISEANSAILTTAISERVRTGM